MTTWTEPDDYASPTDASAFTLSMLGSTAIAGFGTLLLLGHVDQSSVEHAAQGLPVVLTAFGAAQVALGVGVRHWEGALHESVKSAERSLRTAIDSRPDLDSLDQREPDLVGVIRLSQQAEESRCAAAARRAKQKAARWRSTASGIEIAGAMVLLCSAGIAVLVWDLL